MKKLIILLFILIFTFDLSSNDSTQNSSYIITRTVDCGGYISFLAFVEETTSHRITIYHCSYEMGGMNMPVDEIMRYGLPLSLEEAQSLFPEYNFDESNYGFQGA